MVYPFSSGLQRLWQKSPLNELLLLYFTSVCMVQDRLSLLERAVYAALCVNLRPLLSYLHSWHDYVWAYFKALVDHKVEQHIRTNYTASRPLVPLPSSYPDEM